MRVIYSDNGVLTDITRKVEDYKSGTHTFSYTLNQDYIYIGADLPLNCLYFKMGSTVNAVSATMSIEYWDGKDWIDMVEVIDDTIGISQSGHVIFTPNRNNGWDKESTNDQGDIIPALSTLKIYDLYWMRISFSATLTASTIISWIGPLFSLDNDLYAEYPIFNSSALKTAFESGKTTWEEQHVKAASILIKDLISKNVIRSGENILKYQDFTLAAVSKCAQIIFTALGDDYVDDATRARDEYKDRLSNSQYSVDLDNDGILDAPEKFAKVGFMSR